LPLPLYLEFIEFIGLSTDPGTIRSSLEDIVPDREFDAELFEERRASERSKTLLLNIGIIFWRKGGWMHFHGRWDTSETGMA